MSPDSKHFSRFSCVSAVNIFRGRRSPKFVQINLPSGFLVRRATPRAKRHERVLRNESVGDGFAPKVKSHHGVLLLDLGGITQLICSFSSAVLQLGTSATSEDMR